MSQTLKSAADIERMRDAGRLASEVLDFVTPHVRPGVSTGRLNELCHNFMVNVQGTVPAPQRAWRRLPAVAGFPPRP